MTAEQAGAASHAVQPWHTINWSQAHHNVRRLQARIVKATQEGRWNKVKALQHLLTHSYSGKVLAVKRVTENQGSTTPGVDRVIWDTPEKKAAAVHQLRQRGYRPHLSDGCTFQRATGNFARSVFPACTVGQCKLCTCWRLTQWQKA